MFHHEIPCVLRLIMRGIVEEFDVAFRAGGEHEKGSMIRHVILFNLADRKVVAVSVKSLPANT